MQQRLNDTKVLARAVLGGVLGFAACNGSTAEVASVAETMTPGATTTTLGATTTTSEAPTTGGSDASTSEGEAPSPARVTLQIVDDDGHPIEGAIVESDGALYHSRVAGLLDVLVSVGQLETRLVMSVSSTGHTTSSAVFERLASGAEILQVVVLHTLGNPTVLPAAKGGLAERDGVTVEIPPDAFLDEHGDPVKGDVTVTLVPLDPTKPGAMAKMPGPLSALRTDTSAAQLEPVMMVEISAWQAGRQLRLAPGRTAKMVFPVPAALEALVGEGQPVPAWWYDVQHGIWREEGLGVIERVSGELVWVVEVAHFTWWNADLPWNKKNCYDLTILDAQGDPVKNLQVTATGVDYQGAMWSYTEVGGKACVEGKLGGQVALGAGISPNFLAQTQVQGDVQQAGACDGPGSCLPVLLVLDAFDCVPGVQETCYSGPVGTAGVGICAAGVKTVLGDCSWSPCVGDQPPIGEVCATQSVDEDCDGLPQNGCVCESGKKEICNHSNPEIAAKQQLEVGVCQGGTRTCASDGKAWGECEGMLPPESVPTLPQVEGTDEKNCGNILDDNCNGEVNEGCTCLDGSEEDCYTSNEDELEFPLASCKPGTHKCSGGAWGPCQGIVLPQTEQCQTPADEDCDGNSGCCGDGIVSIGEECDEGASNGVYACSSTCKDRKVVQIASGGVHTCALLSNGGIKCWGNNWFGQLGSIYADMIGNEPGEMGDKLAYVDIGTNASAVSIVAGGYHTCALLTGGEVKCWGSAEYGALGGSSQNLGDGPDEMGDKLPFVEFGVKNSVVSLSAGYYHTCAVFDDGGVKCWGKNEFGELGLGDTTARGYSTNEMGQALPFVDIGVGQKPVQVANGEMHSCASVSGGLVKCWGSGDLLGLELSYPDHRGDEPNEMGDKLPWLDLDAVATQSIDAGAEHTCAVLEGGHVKCWGASNYGQLGLGSIDPKGGQAGEMGKFLPYVDLGAMVVAVDVVAGRNHSCALLDSATIKCWGDNSQGKLGIGDTKNRGDDPGEMGDALPIVDVGAPVSALAHGSEEGHQCAVLTDGSAKCWGNNSYGQLGLGDYSSRGGHPSHMGANLPRVKLFSSEW